VWRSKSSPLGSSPIPVSRGDRRRGARGGTPRLRGRNHQLGCCVIIDTMSWEWLDVRPAMAGASAGRGWWHGVLLAGLLLARAGCEASPIGSAPATMPRGDGAVVGGIYPCSGPRLAKNPGCVAGIVTVLRGTAASAPASGGGGHQGSAAYGQCGIPDIGQAPGVLVRATSGPLRGAGPLRRARRKRRY